MRNIVDIKYEELFNRIIKLDFYSKRNLALLGMARCCKVMETFRKTDDLREIENFKDIIYVALQSIKDNRIIDMSNAIQVCERLSESAEMKKTYENLLMEEQLVCDCSYMILEFWFYFLQMDLLMDDGTDYERFILFPAEILKELVFAINKECDFEEIQEMINSNKAIIREITVIDEEMQNIVKINNDLEKFVLDAMKVDI